MPELATLLLLITLSMEVTAPKPSNIKMRRIRRRTGWATTFSASEVVKPTPMKADWAWEPLPPPPA
jgi:hypothetical protein